MTNGDSMDSQMLRPYHGVQWLENPGSYPFRYHRLTSLYGASAPSRTISTATATWTSWPPVFSRGRLSGPLPRMGLDAVIVLEQTAPGRFVRHSLETVTCDHATCDLGDFDGDGKVDLVTGNFFISCRGTSRSRTVRRRLGRLVEESRASWRGKTQDRIPRFQDRYLTGPAPRGPIRGRPERTSRTQSAVSVLPVCQQWPAGQGEGALPTG